MPLYRFPRRTIAQCLSCGHEYVNPVPTVASRAAYSYGAAVGRALNTAIDMGYLNKTVGKYGLQNCSLLDVGRGRGRIARKLIDTGWAPENLQLVDSSEAAVRQAGESLPRTKVVCANAAQVADYPLRHRFPVQNLRMLSTKNRNEQFFNTIHLDYRLSPDFSAVLQKSEAS